MTNRKRFDNLSNAELAKILVKGEWCDGCEGGALKICSTEECVELVRMWLEGKSKDNPPADNESQETIPLEVSVNLRKVAKEIVSECKEHYPNDCEDCRYGDSIGLCCFKQEPPIWDFGAANEATPPDMVRKPAHYVKGNMECIDFIRAIVSDLTPYEAYCLGNVVKYLWRFKDKNGVIDLDKAVRYIEFLKEAQGNEVET